MRLLIIADIVRMMERPRWATVESVVYETMYRCWNGISWFDVPLTVEQQAQFERFEADGFHLHELADVQLIYLYKVISQKMSSASKELFNATRLR